MNKNMEAVFSASNVSKTKKKSPLLVSNTMRNHRRLSKKLFKRLKQRPVRVRLKKPQVHSNMAYDKNYDKKFVIKEIKK